MIPADLVLVQWDAHETDLHVIIDRVGHEAKRAVNVNDSRSPVVASFFGVGFARMVEVHVGGERDDRLFG